MDGLLIAFFVAILLVGGAILFIIGFGRRGASQLDVDKYRQSWLMIEGQLTKDNESSYHLAILNADKLLDQALKQRAFKGETMGERMKSAKDTWKNANAVWSAHKIRNRIAHEPDVKISYNQTRQALVDFKQALKDLGAI